MLITGATYAAVTATGSTSTSTTYSTSTTSTPAPIPASSQHPHTSDDEDDLQSGQTRFRSLSQESIEAMDNLSYDQEWNELRNRRRERKRRNAKQPSYSTLQSTQLMFEGTTVSPQRSRCSSTSSHSDNDEQPLHHSSINNYVDNSCAFSGFSAAQSAHCDNEVPVPVDLSLPGDRQANTEESDSATDSYSGPGKRGFVNDTSPSLDTQVNKRPSVMYL